MRIFICILGPNVSIDYGDGLEGNEELEALIKQEEEPKQNENMTQPPGNQFFFI